MEKIKVRLKQDITEEQFLYATFHNVNFDKYIYDIKKMKDTYLSCQITKDGSFNVKVPRRSGMYIILGYEGDDKLIWEEDLGNHS
jgi:hypothetical protein